MAGMGSFAGGLVDGFVQGSRLADESRLNDLRGKAAGLEIEGLQRKQDLERREQERSDAADQEFAGLMAKETGPLDSLQVAQRADTVAMNAARRGDMSGFKAFQTLGMAHRNEWRKEGLLKADQQFAVTGNPDAYRPLYNDGVQDGFRWDSTEPADGGKVLVRMTNLKTNQSETRLLGRDDFSQLRQNLGDPATVAAREKAHAEHLLKLNEITAKGQVDLAVQDTRTAGLKEVEGVRGQNAQTVERLRQQGGLALEDKRQANPANTALVDQRKAAAGLYTAKTESEKKGKPATTDPVLKVVHGLLGKRLGVDSLDGLTSDNRGAYDQGVVLAGKYRKANPNATPEQIYGAVVRDLGAGEMSTKAGAAPQFEEGTVYTDGDGNKAVYRNGKFEDMP